MPKISLDADTKDELQIKILSYMSRLVGRLQYIYAFWGHSRTKAHSHFAYFGHSIKREIEKGNSDPKTDITRQFWKDGGD